MLHLFFVNAHFVVASPCWLKQITKNWLHLLPPSCSPCILTCLPCSTWSLPSVPPIPQWNPFSNLSKFSLTMHNYYNVVDVSFFAWYHYSTKDSLAKNYVGMPNLLTLPMKALFHGTFFWVICICTINFYFFL